MKFWKKYTSIDKTDLVIVDIHGNHNNSWYWVGIRPNVYCMAVA